MDDLCTIADYEAVYGAAPDEGRVRALIDEASAYLRLTVDVDLTDPDYAEAAKGAVRRMAHAALSGPGDGVSQFQQTAGSYTGQVTYSNPDWWKRLTKAERELFRVDDCWVGTASMGAR